MKSSMVDSSIIIFILWFMDMTQGVDLGQERANKANPMITKGLYEGDMMGIGPEQIHYLVDMSNTFHLTVPPPGINPAIAQFQQQIQAQAVSDPFLIWPNKQLFYEITNDFSEHEKTVIRNSLEEYHQKTCIKMIPRTNQADYVVVKKLTGCYSKVGRISGPQELSLGEDCVVHGIIIHEFMHALGFVHEQSRWDRDTFVKVHLENVDNDAKSNFDKYELGMLKSLNTPYDYNSVMHYGEKYFSKNNKSTIVPLKKGAVIGNRLALSEIDVLELRRMYNCDVTGPPVVNPVSPISPGSIQSGFRIVQYYMQYTVKNAEECKAKCEADILCHGMTYDSGHTFSFANCFLAKPGFTAVDDSAWSAWAKSRLIHPDSVRPGVRIENYYKANTVHNVAECKKLCETDKKCAAMTFDSTNSRNAGNCFLCKADYNLIADKPWSSWMKGNLKPGVHFTVPPYRGFRNYNTLIACVQKCEIDSRCQGMNFYNGNYDSVVNGNCYLYEAAADYGKEQFGNDLGKWTAWIKGVL